MCEKVSDELYKVLGQSKKELWFCSVKSVKDAAKKISKLEEKIEKKDKEIKEKTQEIEDMMGWARALKMEGKGMREELHKVRVENKAAKKMGLDRIKKVVTGR